MSPLDRGSGEVDTVDKHGCGGEICGHSHGLVPSELRDWVFTLVRRISCATSLFVVPPTFFFFFFVECAILTNVNWRVRLQALFGGVLEILIGVYVLVG